MSDTLRDQLLGLGFKAPAKPAKPSPRRDERRGRPDERRGGGKRADGARQDGPSRPPGRRDAQGPRKPRPPREDIDLAKAYAIRAQREKDERIEAERQRQEEARLRREARAKLEAFVKDKALNRADADIARHFEYGGKIKRIHVDAEQLRALNAGELGVVQVNGRYLLVTAAVLAEAETIFAQAVALKVDPSAPAGDDPYSDPQYQVPDDLVW
ncbi:nucleoprotein/polynucleotide-associated enzyme [Xanthomonas citri pv. mangiferaeindicae]|nr:nucleoprotein/polynucleotide-associated enzyme [Xanthomonas citri pv. mangiferaeindicae]